MRKCVSLNVLLLVLFCSISYGLSAQTKAIVGKVTADDGNPLAGVTIVVKGTARAATTNTEGVFSIQAAAGAELEVSHIGYQAQVVKVGDGAMLNITLQKGKEDLDEVVVTAYGIDRQRKTLGYSTPTVAGDDVSQTQRNDFFGGLQGRVPGLSINSTNGNPGASAQIVLRGFVSISGDNNALIVIDGVPVNNTTLNQTNQLVTGGANRDQDYSNRGLDINPNDIENYTIMKGPEATALYGNAGASGAILITTKKGHAGRGSITYSNSFRVEKIYEFPEIQHVYNSGSNGVFSGTTSNFHGPRFADTVTLYDNIHNFFKTGFTQKHNLSFDGGTDKYTYRWSNEYTDSRGTIPNTRYQRLSTRLTGVGQITPILKITTSINFIHSANDKANKGANGSLLQLMRFSSAFDVKDYEDALGNRILHLASIYSEYDNPLWDAYKNINWDKVNRTIANTNVELKPASWLRINGIVGADIAATSGLRVQHAQSYKGSGSAATPTGGRVETYDDLTKIINGSLTATANHKFGNFSNIFIIGGTFSDFNANTNSQMGTNMFDPDFYSINNTLPSTQRARLYVNRRRNMGAFAQDIFGYKSILYLTLSGRLDAASRLMPNNPYFAYPSASVAFNFSDIKGFKSAVHWISYGKFRASYAITGKEPWREYSTGTNYEAKRYTGGGFAYSYYGGNPDLKPERSENFETGLELEFLKGRIGADINFYNLLSKDQIINPRLSYGTGFVLKLINGGTVRNRGMEVQLKGRPVVNNDFSWNITLNYSHNRGTVLSLANELPELYESDTWVVGSTRSAVHPGYSTGVLSGTRFEKNDRGDILISPSSGLPTTSDTRYYPIGDRTPKFNMGLVNQLNYKNWYLSFLWDLRYGGDVMNGTEYESYTKGISVKTLDRENPRIITGVLKDGLENTDHPTPNTIAITPYYTSAYYTTNVSPEMFVEKNIKTLRLRDVTLSYDLPQSLMHRSGVFTNVNLFVTLTDAVLFTNYSSGDPESNANTPGLGGIGGFGIDYGNVGKPIGMNFGLKLKL
ncbi:SusC/RagA family TonB-linked outer membrane protein [Niabella hirudinis]|uniref:SusC/RagA family TonB-linked outer membrane protein n=1 Tax=Niabella hirudinis TaxID=1285929 RepID=UPI003EBABD29